MSRKHAYNVSFPAGIAAIFVALQVRHACRRGPARGGGIRFLFLLIASLALPASLRAASYDNVPPGFEYLLEKQTTEVDVVFGGKLLGSFLADYQPGRVRFRHPAAIVNNIPNLIQEDRAEITRELVQALSGELDAHTEKSCYPIKKPDCDLLRVDVAGVIFNPDNFQAILFINPSYLELLRNGARDEYHAPPETGLTNLNRLGLALSGSNQSDPVYSLNARMLFGNDETHFIANALVTSEYALSSNELLLERDMPGYFYGGGLFRSTSPPLVNAPLLYGGEIATSYRTQVNREQNLGNELAVFLPRPAQVEIWRDGRILSVGAYPAGNVVLDTRTLPQGNYLVTLKIREASGVTAEQTRFFIKSDTTPQAGLPLVTAELGKIAMEKEGLPSADGDFWAHGSLRHRVNENLALGGDALVVGGSVAGSARVQWFADQWISNAALTVTSKANTGLTLDFRKDFRSVMTINANAIQTWISDRSDQIPLYNVALGNTTQLNGQLSISFPKRSRLSVFGNYKKSDSIEPTYSIGAEYKIPVWRFGQSQLYLTASATRSSFDSVALLQVELIGNSRNSNWMLRGGYEAHSELESGATLAGSYGVTKTDFLTGTGSLSVGAEQLANQDKRIYTNGALHNTYGRLTAGAQMTQRANLPGSSTSYYANYQTGLLATGRGFGYGGANIYDSAALVHLEGAPGVARFDVYVDGQVRAKGVPSGASVPLFLSPYYEHKLYIRGVNAPSVEYDPTERTIVLFSGNVQDLVWRIKSLHVVFGRLLDESGMPLRNTVLEGLDGPVRTDEHGYFQGEITGATAIRATLPDGQACRVAIGPEQLTGELIRLGSMTCRTKAGLFIPVRDPRQKPAAPTLTYNEVIE
ncbi:MAG TPA: hypothetical protein EYP40_01685 [Chromatiales bacterium]|nr:hypothetical protein [Chromatiales bacterium]